MSNPSEQASRNPYIIICNGRIAVLTARTTYDKVNAASQAATSLVTYYGERVDLSDTSPISNLQHAMMDVLSGENLQRTRSEQRSLDEMVDEMFALLDRLEEKLSY